MDSRGFFVRCNDGAGLPRDCGLRFVRRLRTAMNQSQHGNSVDQIQTVPKTVERLLKRTRSRCPVCHAACPAEVIRIGDAKGKVVLRRTCPDHGVLEVCIASDARFYWL